MNAFFRLYFTTDEDKITSVTIPNAYTGYHPNAVKQAMQTMITYGMVKTGQGTLTGIDKAKFYKINTTKSFNVSAL